jgi:nitrite reductase/ring-hydroxylating ferredoxin subunit
VPLDVVALNDVAIEELAGDRQASIAVYVTGRHFGYFSADALSVASSTGSTAYSFQASGPIVSPQLDALIFTSVAPHMIFDRSLVLAVRDERVALGVLDRSGQVAVSVDEQLRGVSRRCRHLGADLANGTLAEHGHLVCPWHQSAYDVHTGRMVRGPQGVFAKVPGLDAAYRALTRVLPLRRGQVLERNGRLFVC